MREGLEGGETGGGGAEHEPVKVKGAGKEAAVGAAETDGEVEEGKIGGAGAREDVGD